MIWRLFCCVALVMILASCASIDGEYPQRQEGLHPQKGPDGKYGFVDRSGQWWLEPAFEEVGDFQEGLAKVKLGGRYGFVDVNGKLVVPCVYTSAEDFSEGLAAVEINGKWGFVNMSGELVIPAKYERVMAFEKGLAFVSTDSEKYGFIDTQGQAATAELYDEKSGWDFFTEGICSVAVNGKAGAIDRYGRLVVPMIYDRVEVFSEGLAAVQTNGKWGFVNSLGKLVIPAKYEGARSFENGLAFVSTDSEKYGFIDTKGRAVTAELYDDIAGWGFSEGICFVEVDGKIGGIDRSGKTVVPMMYDGAEDFSGGLALVQKEGFWGIVDNHGKVLVPPSYLEIGSLRSGRAFAVYIEDGMRKPTFIDRKGHRYDRAPWTEKTADEYYQSEGQKEPFTVVGVDGKWTSWQQKVLELYALNNVPWYVDDDYVYMELFGDDGKPIPVSEHFQAVLRKRGTQVLERDQVRFPKENEMCADDPDRYRGLELKSDSSKRVVHYTIKMVEQLDRYTFKISWSFTSGPLSGARAVKRVIYLYKERVFIDIISYGGGIS